MNESLPSFTDLALFLEVADCGSLTAASKRTNVPLPTLSRRMTSLERETGRALFRRGKSGYRVTADGEALAEQLAGLRVMRRSVDRWMQQGAGPAPVRITAGIWTSRHLARTLTYAANVSWVPIFLPSDALLDLPRRAADIGLRNAPPEHPWLARQKLRRIDYAIYAVGPQISGFVGLPNAAGLTASQRWLHNHHGDDVRVTAANPRLCLDLALNGFGKIVLPCFAGDAEPELTRQSDLIAGLSHDEWLVSHHQARNDPAIRDAITALQAALSPT
ncbi:LysR family transcriptional regulator [Pelagimonas varians]|uniref:DNA-binding transcriptional activator TdcA n=1 Tax=Pelagimonas varians TaxID=696760 RepID=A0A238K2H2_9RHOB|nr:LysR family transcriptional regulator [Pelagimonas varians]PYG33260.1 LysR family transcriptional regulator [Pelagimonas varians]SMX36156.1 DNA-binding transcriptional activator TdcA [Pelagimonas varians]